jgi:hypothetical protein
MTMKFSNDALYDIYNMITGSDAEFIKGLARAAIATAIDVQTDMFRDSEPGTQAPTDTNIRDFAHDFGADMLNEFKESLLQAIKDVKFTGNVKVVQSVESELVFE